MALEYTLTLGGTTPVNQVAERAMPDPGERPTGTAPLLAADLYERYGFELVVVAGEDGYLPGAADDGSRDWEPAAYVALTFGMDKFAARGWVVTNILTVVRRVLDSGTEDAALVLNGDVLLLTRFGG